MFILYIIDNESNHCVFGYCNKNNATDHLSLSISNKKEKIVLNPGIGFVTFDTYKCIKKNKTTFFLGLWGRASVSKSPSPNTRNPAPTAAPVRTE